MASLLRYVEAAAAMAPLRARTCHPADNSRSSAASGGPAVRSAAAMAAAQRSEARRTTASSSDSHVSKWA